MDREEKLDSRSLIALSAGVLNDLTSVLGIPLSAGTELIRQHLNKRAREGREVLLNELRRAGISELKAASQDESISIIYRYGLAIRDGAARANLILLAKAISGLSRRDRLYADEFSRFAEILSRLNRDEILILGTLHRYRKIEEKKQGKGVSTHQWWPKAIKELVPASFPSEEYIVALCCSALRTGLLTMPNDIDSTGEYATSPIMDEIAELIDFQDVMDELRS